MLLTQDTAALLGDHSQEQANDLSEETQAMPGDGFSHYVAALVIPIAAFSG